MSESYSDAPKSFNERRADSGNSSRLWQPRDALIKMLREIDAGRLNPDALAIVYFVDNLGDKQSQFTVQSVIASPHRMITIAMLSQALTDATT